MSLKHIVAIVTGGASGLGRVTSTRLVQQGARVVLCDLPSSEGFKVAKELGDKARFIPTDVVNEKEISDALDLAESAFGRSVNAAVNHAGVVASARTLTASLEVHSMDVFRRTLEINMVGTFLVSRLAAQRMAKEELNELGERGVIINTSSIMAFEGTNGRVAYAASKAALVGMTLPMARDLGRFGIRVVTIAPGSIATPMFNGEPEELREGTYRQMAFPRSAGQASEVAHAVQFIIENPLINGETIRLDAGMRLGHSSVIPSC